MPPAPPGLHTLAKADKSVSELWASARRGELSLAEQLGITRKQSNHTWEQANLANLGSPLNLGGPSAGGSTYLTSLTQALGGYGRQRQRQFQASMFNAQQPGPPSFLGSILGLGMGAFLGGLGGGARYGLGTRFFGSVPKGIPDTYQPDLFGRG
jgi:hypothetical protein